MNVAPCDTCARAERAPWTVTGYGAHGTRRTLRSAYHYAIRNSNKIACSSMREHISENNRRLDYKIIFRRTQDKTFEARRAPQKIMWEAQRAKNITIVICGG